MPSSRWDNIPDIINILRRVKPKSILDVGCGFGKWGFLAREYCDVWEGHYYKNEWQTKVDAIEIFPQYIQPWHREIYDSIFIGDITDFPIEHYDLILACDVIEHISDEKLPAVMAKLRDSSENLIVSVPLGLRPQGKGFGNEFETHRSTWTMDKLKTYKPSDTKIHGQQALGVWYKSLRCLFVANSDWANMGYLLAKSLQSVGVDAKAITFHSHPFGYKEQATLSTQQAYHNEVAKADIIIAMHSQYTPCDLKGKKFFVFHGGTAYRANPAKINETFNNLVTGSILQHWEFLDKGAKNPHWLLPPIDLTITPDYAYYGKVFAHYPRDAKAKGANAILRAFQGIVPIDYSDELVSHQASLARMSQCDVYVEMLSGPEWGMTALEAAALGKIVITTFHGLDEYSKQYGECELIVANTEDELRQRVRQILGWTEEEILHKKMATRNWVEKYHSFEAVGRRLKEIVC